MCCDVEWVNLCVLHAGSRLPLSAGNGFVTVALASNQSTSLLTGEGGGGSEERREHPPPPPCCVAQADTNGKTMLHTLDVQLYYLHNVDCTTCVLD